MSLSDRPVAIINYGMGNLYSVKHACEQVGLQVVITSSRVQILSASAVIVPGVGAFGDAMAILHRLDLVSVLRDVADSSVPLMGVCLGMQLLMTESYEFGRHKGLGIIPGEVRRLEAFQQGPKKWKVPHIGWNRLCPNTPSGWSQSLLRDLPPQSYMYFVHSYYPVPEDPSVVLSTTPYGPVEFCSTLQRGRLFACQYHPERSGPEGLRIYQNLASLIRETRSEEVQHA